MRTKRSLRLVLMVLGFLLLTFTGIRTISHPDIFTHIALGRANPVQTDTLSYTLSGPSWINMHPLYNRWVWMLWSLGGAGLVTVVHVLIVLSAFILMLRTFGKEWGGPLSQSLALLLCARLMLPVFHPGPSAFFMLFTALFLTLLYRVKNFNLLAGLLLILQVLWTNTHPSFLFGPLLVLLYAVENRQKTPRSPRVAMRLPLSANLFVLAGATLAVTLLNPNLIQLHGHILSNWRLLTGTENLEWISLFSSSFPQESLNNLTRFALLLGACGLITLQKRLPILLTSLALIGAFLLVRSIGSLHFFAFLAFPFMALSFHSVGEYLSRPLAVFFKASKTWLYGLPAGITLGLMLISLGALITNRSYVHMGSASRFGLGVEEGAFPVAAAGIFSRPDFPKYIFNLAHDGGYIALQAPERKVFCDTRSSFYGASFYKTLQEALLQPVAWQTILSDWNPHAVILNGCAPNVGDLTKRLIASELWKLVYFDGTTILLVRDLPEYATLIQDRAIQKYGMQVLEKEQHDGREKGRGWIQAGNSSRLIGAGNLYLALNRLEQAQQVYGVLVKNSPSMAGAWLGLGQSLIGQHRPEGVEYMEKAASITPRNGHIWIELLQAYRMTGDEAKARTAAKKINRS